MMVYSIWRNFMRAGYVSCWDQPLSFMLLGASGNTYIGDILLAQLSGLLFCFCFMLQRTNHSEPFASLVL